VESARIELRDEVDLTRRRYVFTLKAV